MNQRDLKRILSYDENSGEFMWKTRLSNRGVVGKIAGTPSTHGHVQIRINGVFYKAHRLAWLYVYGELPDGEIDHINHNPYDNRISNLRNVSHKENARNQSMRKTNTSGVTGVYFYKRDRKWDAKIMVDGAMIHLGRFVNKIDAIIARKMAEQEYGFHPNHGVKDVV